MKWLVTAVIALAGVSGVSAAAAIDARSQLHAKNAGHSTAAGQSLAAQVAALRARVARDEGAVDGDNPGPGPAHWSPLQRDVHDLGSVVIQQQSGGSDVQLRQAVNDLLATCRGSAAVYEALNLRPPSCPDDVH